MTGSYLATFDKGTREPHPFTLRAEEYGDSVELRDSRAWRVASSWAGFSELFRRTDLGYVRIEP